MAMNVPAPMPGVPLGLEYLTMLDLIMVHQVWNEPKMGNLQAS